MNKRLIVIILTLVMGLAMLAPAAQAIQQEGPPVLVNGYNYSTDRIELTFDRYLQGGGSLDLSGITVAVAGDAVAVEAYSESNAVTIIMDKPLTDVPSVTVSLAEGVVHSYGGQPNAAVSGYKVLTLAGIVSILEAMNAQLSDPDIRHIVKYMRMPNVGNVVGDDGIGREDARFLASLIGLRTTSSYHFDMVIEQAEGALAEGPDAGSERTALQNRLMEAKAAREAEAPSLYTLSLATVELTRALHAYSTVPEPEPRGLHAEVTGVMGGDGYARITVAFSAAVHPDSLGRSADALIEYVKIGFGGQEERYFEPSSQNKMIERSDWDGDAVYVIDFLAGPEDVGVHAQSIEIAFHDGVVLDLDGIQLASPVVTYTIERFEAGIEQVQMDSDGYIESFNIRFTKELSDYTTGLLADASELFRYIDIYDGVEGQEEIEDFSEVEVTLDPDDAKVLRVNVTGLLRTADWVELVVELNDENIIAVDESHLEYYGTNLYYYRPPYVVNLGHLVGMDNEPPNHIPPNSSMRIDFSAPLGDAARESVEQAVKEAVNGQQLSSNELYFDWVDYGRSVEIRNFTQADLNIEYDVYATLSEVPNAEPVKIIDLPFMAVGMYGMDEGQQLTGVIVLFGEPPVDRPLTVDQLIERVNVSNTEVSVISMEWDLDAGLDLGMDITALFIGIEPTAFNVQSDVLEVTFVEGAIRNSEGETIRIVSDFIGSGL